MRRALVVVGLLAVVLWAAPGALAAGWCGSGETSSDRPDAVTDPQVHAVYAVPADGADDFAAVANRIADDLASVDTWWRGQDPTRTVRFDDAVFPTCTALDISFVRLPQPAAAYVGASTSLKLIAGSLADLGLDDPYKRYLVYFDGSAADPGVCGTGGGQFAMGPAYAVVWLAGCPNVPDDAIAAHELLHALGALPAGAPHACPADAGGVGHPCDNPLDVLYPYSASLPLAQLLLDAGHDDYYAHSGTWIDIQDSAWLHRLDLPQVTLAVAIDGAGGVYAEQPGLVCAAACTTRWDQNAQVTLDASPSPTTRFVRWSGACTGSGKCILTMSRAESATALFGPQLVSVRTAVKGQGRVVCRPACSPRFLAGAVLSLRAVPARGWRFAGWSGACKGTKLVCRPATDFPLAARATFRRRASR